MSKQANKRLPPDVIEQWPDVFSDLDISIVPVEYVDSFQLFLTDGRRLDISCKTSRAEDVLSEFFDTYRNQIEDVKFYLDTVRVKDDVIRDSARFLKLFD